MDHRLLNRVLPLLLVLSIPCVTYIPGAKAQGDASTSRFDFARQIGVGEIDAQGKGCLAIDNSQLKANEAIHLVFASKPQMVIKSTILEKLSENCSRDSQLPNHWSFYSFRLGRQAKLAGPAVVVAGFHGAFGQISKNACADLNGDGSRECFRSCTSAEGVHLTIWIGRPLRSKRLWHHYFYLGYDVEPSCTAKDFED